MALIKCPDCGREISDAAPACIGCGRPITTPDKPPSPVLKEADPASPVEAVAQTSSVNNYVCAKPSGVGGWLLLLIIGMMVLGPLLGAARIVAEIWKVEQEFPKISTLDDWVTLKSAICATFFGFAAISFYGGWGLARSRDWAVVRRAKAILWITGPVALFVMMIIIPILTFGKWSAGIPEFVGGLIASVIGAGIWTAYLSKSKRVRNTYGGRLLGIIGDDIRNKGIKEGSIKNKGIITILVGIGVIFISIFFSSGSHPKLDLMGNISRMEIVIKKGGDFKPKRSIDEIIAGTGNKEERVAIPLKYPLSLSALLILIGTGIVLVSKNKGPGA